MKIILLAIIVAFQFCHVSSVSAESLKDKASAVIKEAKSTNKKAIKLKNEWRDVRKLIKAAVKAHSEENYQKSMDLAEEALNQAKMSIEQYNKQKDNYRFLDD
ncbi:MAG: hypothetical protein CMD82_03120 [Gammaproteobacteria bacterium]|nr:hypothetical protein [Gammaproteobacteria bacterium]|tara:strand:+ start:58 stop:366 length:309 start_codon:yes stop_codon:yes gene_type:complete